MLTKLEENIDGKNKSPNIPSKFFGFFSIDLTFPLEMIYIQFSNITVGYIHRNSNKYHFSPNKESSSFNVESEDRSLTFL